MTEQVEQAQAADAMSAIDVARAALIRAITECIPPDFHDADEEITRAKTLEVGLMDAHEAADFWQETGDEHYRFSGMCPRLPDGAEEWYENRWAVAPGLNATVVDEIRALPRRRMFWLVTTAAMGLSWLCRSRNCTGRGGRR